MADLLPDPTYICGACGSRVFGMGFHSCSRLARVAELEEALIWAAEELEAAAEALAESVGDDNVRNARDAAIRARSVLAMGKQQEANEEER